ncbi:MAG: Gfo/Idh/MocA family oxidoreductase [Acidobacteriota bacterium]
MRSLRFAMIGTGFWAQFQIGAWTEISDARLVAVCDRDRGRAEAVARRFGIPQVYDDAVQLFSSEHLDFVDIAAGPEAHPALVFLAAQQRIPVICQKPMALDLHACRQMVDLCRKAGVPLLIHENYRWQEPMRRVRQALLAGRIGRPFRAHIQFSHGDIRLFDNQSYLFKQPHFAMFDMGPHLLDLARFFFGEPLSVYCREYRIHPLFRGEDIVSVLLGYEELTCHCELSWRTTDYEVFIEGEVGTLKWDTQNRLIVTTEAGKSVKPLVPQSYHWADPRYGFAHSSIVSANADLLSALKGEGQAETSGDDNLKTMQLMDLALQSARHNQVMPVPNDGDP